jgi:hypothetical protein
MAYVVKRSNRHGAERFTGMSKAADGTYMSAGTYDTPSALRTWPRSPSTTPTPKRRSSPFFS